MRQDEKVPYRCAKCADLDPPTHAQIPLRAFALQTFSSRPLLAIHYVVSNDLLANSEGPDKTARMRRLIWAFTVRIYLKTHFRMARPI